MQPRTLVSMTNLPQTSATGLVLVDVLSGAFEPVELGWERGTERCTGLALDEDHVYVLFESHLEWLVAVLARADLKPMRTVPLPGVRDPHSIVVRPGAMTLVATGTDEVLEFRFLDDELSHASMVWRAGDSGGDEHHLNSLALYGGRLVVAGLGAKRGDLWATATDGFIREIPDGPVLAEGIEHPHSIAPRGPALAFCESQRRMVRTLDGRSATLAGYTRGLTWLGDDVLAAGESIGRRISKSTGRVANPDDPGEFEGRCGISVLDLARGTIEWRVDLSAVGPEIYDVLAID